MLMWNGCSVPCALRRAHECVAGTTASCASAASLGQGLPLPLPQPLLLSMLLRHAPGEVPCRGSPPLRLAAGLARDPAGDFGTRHRGCTACAGEKSSGQGAALGWTRCHPGAFVFNMKVKK